ncbi:hypothetical protein Pyn_27313 [Prunus yedoensis var. nudiflora]|uniref:Uncharacterized protein n=1 Tax=Prunus yedoensis var. nudiflora TaxID=2094558 RepID=A0A314ZQ01_PRUYE|nr:hypothetical protein Pyn_27313 [Prunus yedoensis var. nudiflora]
MTSPPPRAAGRARLAFGLARLRGSHIQPGQKWPTGTCLLAWPPPNLGLGLLGGVALKSQLSEHIPHTWTFAFASKT